MKFALGVLILLAFTLPAQAKRQHHHHWGWAGQHHNGWQGGWWQYPHQVRVKKAKRTKKAHRSHVRRAGLVTVPTAAGIKITVSPSFAPRITAFIADLVEQGYTPKSIHCFARGGHVHGSRHYSGNACDIDQRAWNRTAPTMYRVTALAKRHGLRDGGSFGDHGHIDDGRPLSRTRIARSYRHGPHRVAEAMPFLGRHD